MELKRILSKKYILIIVFAFLVNLILFVYENVASIESTSKYSQIISELQDMDCNAALSYIKENKLASKDPAYKLVQQKLNYIKDYHTGIEKVVANAKTLQNNVLFSDESSFSYNNLIRTERDFTKLLSVVPVLDNDFAVEKVSQYRYHLFIVILVMAVVIFNIYAERDNRMWQLVRIGKNGRKVLAGKRVCIVMAYTFALTGLLYIGIAVAAFIIYGGIAGVLNPIQNLSQFGKSALQISKMGYLFLNFWWTYLAVLAVVSVIYLLLTIFRNKKNIAICITAFTVVEYLLYTKLESQSVYGIFKNVNLFNLFNVSDICMNYKNIGTGTMVIQLGTVLLFVLCAVAAISLVLSVFIYSRMYPDIKVSLLTKLLNKLGEQYQKILSKAPAMLKEIHKTIFSVRAVWLIMGVGVATVYFSNTGFLQFPVTQLASDAVYLEHGGSDYAYIENYTNQVIAQYMQAKKEYDDVMQKYLKGEIAMSDTVDIQMNFEYYGLQYASVSEFLQKLQYLEKLEREREIKGFLMSDRGYYQTFGGDCLQRELIIFIILQIFAILVANGVVALENRSGMIKLITSSSKGIFCIKVRKMAALIISVGTVSAIMYALDYINVLKHYGAPFCDAPLQSLTFMENVPFHVSIWQWIVLLVLAKAAVTVATAVTVYWVRSVRNYKL